MPHPHRPHHPFSTPQNQRPHFRGLTEQNLKGDQYEADWFTIEFAFGSIAAAASATVINNVQADSAFELLQLTGVGNKNGEAEPWISGRQLPFTIFITDTGTGRQLMSAPVKCSNIVGRGDLPFILPQSRIFIPKATIQVQLVSFSGSTWDNIAISFVGKKLFEYGRPS